MLQGFERSQTATQGLQLGATVTEPGTRLMFFAGQFLVFVLALVEQRSIRFHFAAMLVVISSELFRGGAQGHEISRVLFLAQRFQTASSLHRLPIEIIQARAFYFCGLTGIGTGLGVLVPLPLPFGEARFRVALRIGRLRRYVVDCSETRLAFSQSAPQGVDLFAIGTTCSPSSAKACSVSSRARCRRSPSSRLC